jgi:arylsulfatase A-like enzyme
VNILAADHAPNILLILADDVGRDAIGCYGGESYATPNIDLLAERGLRFEHFYSAPVCHPTRISLLTGKYLSTAGCPGWGRFPKGEREKQTLAQALRDAGYATAAAGKWQLTKLEDDPQHPHRVGFDEYCLFGWHEGPRYWQPLLWQNGKRREDVQDRYGPDVYVEFLIDFMKRSREKPFFAFYSMALCHAVSNDLDPHPAYGPSQRYMTFAEMMASMDQCVGRIVQALDDLGLGENTIVMFTSDNGTTPLNFIRHEGRKLIREDTIYSVCRGQRIRGGKGTLTDWGIRVPTVVRWSGKIPAGQVTDALADVTDVFPTFCELSGMPIEIGVLDGRSFAGVMLRGESSSREWVISQMANKACIRTANWKLTHDGQLFDMKNDPDETQVITPEQDTEQSTSARRKLQRLLGPYLKS